jgi:hypothetical protein
MKFKPKTLGDALVRDIQSVTMYTLHPLELGGEVELESVPNNATCRFVDYRCDKCPVKEYGSMCTERYSLLNTFKRFPCELTAWIYVQMLNDVLLRLRREG